MKADIGKVHKPQSSRFARRPYFYTISSTEKMCIRDQQGLLNMCTDVIHKYTCGHTKKDRAPCAGARGGTCKGTSQKVISHSERCAACGKCTSGLKSHDRRWQTADRGPSNRKLCQEALPFRHLKWLIFFDSSEPKMTIDLGLFALRPAR